MDGLQPGFADPVHDAQQIFRGILTAMSEPGRVCTTAAAPLGPPPLAPATVAVALTLLDVDTPVWLAPSLATPQVQTFLRFHTGCPVVDAPAAAAFALALAPLEAPRLADFPQGSAEYPDRSLTLILQLDRLDDGAGVTLRGPGIADHANLSAAPLTADFWDQIRDNHGRFPLGIDVIFTAGTQIAALPRSTQVEG